MRVDLSRGFTLIEIMMVVAIISVLAAIAIPQFNEYRSNANDVKARSDVRNAIAGMAVSARR